MSSIFSVKVWNMSTSSLIQESNPIWKEGIEDEMV